MVEKMSEQISEISPKQYCVLPLRDIVIFPNITTTILVGRPKSLAAVKEAEEQNDMSLALGAESARERPWARDILAR